MTVQVGFHQLDDAFVHLFTEAVDELDAVVVVGVVAGGDHDAAVKPVGTGHIGHGGGGGHVEQVGIRPGGNQSAHQGVFKHVAGAAGVLADDNPGRIVTAGPALQLAVVPAQKTAHLISVVSSQTAVGLPPEAVGSKIFTHEKTPFEIKARTKPVRRIDKLVFKNTCCHCEPVRTLVWQSPG